MQVRVDGALSPVTPRSKGVHTRTADANPCSGPAHEGFKTSSCLSASSSAWNPLCGLHSCKDPHTHHTNAHIPHIPIFSLPLLRQFSLTRQYCDTLLVLCTPARGVSCLLLSTPSDGALNHLHHETVTQSGANVRSTIRHRTAL